MQLKPILQTLVAALGLIFTTASSADPRIAVPTSPRSIVEWRLVGFTETLVTGSIERDGQVGFAAMHGYCAAEVSPHARACFSPEVARSAIHIAPEARYWVIPELSAPVEFDGRGWIVFEPTTGFGGSRVSSTPSRALTNFSCDSYRSVASGGFDDGLTITSQGFFATPCAQERQIACCAPAVIPVVGSLSSGSKQ